MSKEAKFDYNRVARTSRSSRHGVTIDPDILMEKDAEVSPWHESETEILEGLRYGAIKARQLRWVRSQMELRLSAVEQRCVTLYYFQGMNYRDAGDILGVNPSSVYRAVQRGVRKLRKAARDTVWFKG